MKPQCYALCSVKWIYCGSRQQFWFVGGISPFPLFWITHPCDSSLKDWFTFCPIFPFSCQNKSILIGLALALFVTCCFVADNPPYTLFEFQQRTFLHFWSNNIYKTDRKIVDCQLYLCHASEIVIVSK